jgi:hypothetical protein
MTTHTGYIRPRGSMLEALIKIDGRKVRKSTGLPLGRERDAEAILEAALRQCKSPPPASSR